ncbi:capsular polysaccharide biosynthesis protein [Bacteroidia bacterium]|nr:capsular polysaccharide biosynthesis protein [Bacteroidia bacterium]
MGFAVPARAQDTLNVMFIGDVMAHQPQINAAKTDAGYNFDTCFAHVKPLFAQADMVIANLEVTLAGAPYSGYPEFSAPDELAVALKNAGVTALVTANNHSCDKRKRGIVRTLQVLDSLEIPHTGTFYDTAHRRKTQPLLLQKNNITLAVLNYTYGTNGIPTPAPTVVNRIDTAQMVKDIAAARALCPDMIAVVMHWGVEYELYANREQRNLAQFLQRQGVALIIGSHPHVLQGMQMHYAPDSSIQSAVVYSLGNFVSNMTAANTEMGVMANFCLIKNAGTTRIAAGSYRFTWVYKPTVNGHRRYYIIPAAEYANIPSFFERSEAYERMKASLNNVRELYNKTTMGFTEDW